MHLESLILVLLGIFGGLVFTSKKILKEAAVPSLLLGPQAVQYAGETTADKRLEQRFANYYEEEALAAAVSSRNRKNSTRDLGCGIC